MAFSGAACSGPLPLRQARDGLLDLASGLFQSTDSLGLLAANICESLACQLELSTMWAIYNQRWSSGAFVVVALARRHSKHGRGARDASQRN